MARVKKDKSRSRRRVRWLRVLLLLIVLLGLLACGTLVGFIASAAKAMPQITRPKPQLTSFIYDKNGDVLTKLYGLENRIPVSLEEMPQHLRDAFVAIEDHRFYSHFGLDIARILKSFWVIIRTDQIQGASTITQQLARNAWPIGSEQTYTRKIQEAILAIQLERNYIKDEILEMYLNQIPLGHGAHGVEAAAQVYFGKHVQELTLAESAVLAGLPKAHSIYSPYINMEACRSRQKTVLEFMVKHEYITADEMEEALAQPLELQGLKTYGDYPSPSFVDHVLHQLLKKYPEEQVYGGGLKIFTTLDPKIQEAAEQAVSTYLDEHFPLGQFERDMQAAVVIMDPFTGELRAMVGGRTHDNILGHNRVWQTYRQPGSAFKPLAVYTPALESGWTAATVVDDAPVSYSLVTGQTWVPHNYRESGWPLGAYRGLTTVREAIRRSVNVVAVKVLNEIGIDAGLEAAQRLGISSLVTTGPRNDHNLSLALGGLTKGVSPLDMVTAYSTFAAGGARPKPFSITRVLDQHGTELEKHEPSREMVLDPAVAYVMTDMLKSVVETGHGGYVSNWNTGYRAELPDWPVAGKTGTTSDSVDLWWVGYTPDYAGAVWLGCDQPADMTRVFDRPMRSGEFPAYIWRDIMRVAHEGLTPHDFDKPTKVVERTICIKSGLMPGPNCPETCLRKEVFVKGTEPMTECDRHVKAEVCSEHPHLLWDRRCPLPSHPVTKVFLDRPIIEEHVIDERGQQMPLPWDMADALPQQSCADVYPDTAPEPIEGMRHVIMRIHKGYIQPPVIKLEVGQRVRLTAYSLDVEHELSVPELGIHLQIGPRTPGTCIIPTEVAGRYEMSCTIHYPAENSTEKGFIVVEQPE